MRKYTDKELLAILADLAAGEKFCGITENGRGTGLIYLTDNLYIGWNYYGSSANDFSVDSLRFILETIFNECKTICKAVYSEYHINWIPAGTVYIGVDMSRSHPNVYGL